MQIHADMNIPTIPSNQYIFNNPNNTEIRVLAEFIKKYINKEVAKVSITYSTKNKGKETGDYDSSTKEITIYKKYCYNHNNK